MTCLQNSRRDYRVLREEKNSSSSAVLDSDASWQIFSPVRPTSSSTKASCSEQQQQYWLQSSRFQARWWSNCFCLPVPGWLDFGTKGAKPGKAWPLHAASKRFCTLQYKCLLQFPLFLSKLPLLLSFDEKEIGNHCVAKLLKMSHFARVSKVFKVQLWIARFDRIDWFEL